MANPFDDPDFGKTARKPNPFDDPDYRGPSVGPGPSALSRAGTYVDDIIRQFAQGGLMGFADEATAALSEAATMPGRAVTGQGPPRGQTYDEELRRNRLRDGEFTKNNPVASGVAQVGGAIATLPLTLAPRAAGFIGRTLAGAATGAGYGGVAGFGHGTGGFDERLINAGIGAGGGALLGGALPTAASTAGFVGRGLRESRAGQWVGENLAAPAYEKTAGVVEALAPKVRPGNLSAAAPEGGQPIPVDSPMLSVAEALRRRATAARDTSTRGAQERLAREFDRYGLDPQNVGRELDRLGPAAMLPNAAPLGTLDRTARTAYDAPGPAAGIIDEALTAQRHGAPRRIQGVFEGTEPPPTIYDAQRYLTANTRQVGADVYDPLRQGGIQISDDMTRLLESNPAIREAYDNVVANATYTGQTLSPFDVMHRIKRQLNLNATTAGDRSRPPINMADIDDVAMRWERELYRANPQIQAADEAYRGAAQLPDLLEQGRQFMRTGTSDVADSVSPSALAATLPQLDPAARLAFRVGATNTARDVALQGAGPTRRLAGNIDENQILQEKLVEIYGYDRALEIIRAAGNERSMLRTDAAIRGGSQTASKLAHLVDDGLQLPNPASVVSAPNLAARVWDAGANMLRRQNAGNEPVRTEIARILTERNPTANLQNLDVIEALMRQRFNAQMRNARIGGGTSAAGGGELGGYLGP